MDIIDLTDAPVKGWAAEGDGRVAAARGVQSEQNVTVDRDLPAGDEYGAFLGRFLDQG